MDKPLHASFQLVYTLDLSSIYQYCLHDHIAITPSIVLPIKQVEFNCDISLPEGYIFLVYSPLHCYTIVQIYTQLCVNNVEVTVNTCHVQICLQ